MKKILYFFLFATFLSCGSFHNAVTDNYGYISGWRYVEMPPSQVTTSGATFYTIKLSNKSYSVGGYIDDPDATFYYNALWQDLNWYRNIDGNWSAPYGSHRPKDGYLYFDIKRGVAIYNYTDGSNAFRVTLDVAEED